MTHTVLKYYVRYINSLCALIHSFPPILSISFASFFLLCSNMCTVRSFQPLDLQLTQNAVIGAGAALGGVLIIAILALAIGLLVYVIWQRRLKTGKHETLVEEEEFDRRQRRREKRRKM